MLRLLDKDKALITLDQLGMQPSALEAFSKSFRRAYGATLVTGPTGSGKTTSLYAAVNIINTPEKNIITIEDPAEYQIRGITQVQVNVRTGLTFAAGLRSIVRSDPDVIMIGEIRDRETAQIAVESALTGHLVLSTLHTNDAPSAMTRLTEMGIEPFLTASAIDCVVSQRLARLLCSSCKEPVILTVDQLRQSDFAVDQDVQAYEARGCQRCSHIRLQGPRRPIRGDAGHRRDPHARDRAGARGRDPLCRGRAGHGPARGRTGSTRSAPGTRRSKKSQELRVLRYLPIREVEGGPGRAAS